MHSEDKIPTACVKRKQKISGQIEHDFFGWESGGEYLLESKLMNGVIAETVLFHLLNRSPSLWSAFKTGQLRWRTCTRK